MKNKFQIGSPFYCYYSFLAIVTLKDINFQITIGFFCGFFRIANSIQITPFVCGKIVANYNATIPGCCDVIIAKLVAKHPNSNCMSTGMLQWPQLWGSVISSSHSVALTCEKVSGEHCKWGSRDYGSVAEVLNTAWNGKNFSKFHFHGSKGSQHSAS